MYARYEYIGHAQHGYSAYHPAPATPISGTAVLGTVLARLLAQYCVCTRRRRLNSSSTPLISHRLASVAWCCLRLSTWSRLGIPHIDVGIAKGVHVLSVRTNRIAKATLIPWAEGAKTSGSSCTSCMIKRAGCLVSNRWRYSPS